MVLDWVYGCRGCDVNKNLWILKSGELVYFVSTTVVIYNRVKETQRHYRGHTEEITCMDINPSKNLGLSGQRNGKTHDSRYVLYSRIPCNTITYKSRLTPKKLYKKTDAIFSIYGRNGINP